MTAPIRRAAAAALLLTLASSPARAQTVQELQAQIDELKAQIAALTKAQAAQPVATAAPAAVAAASSAPPVIELPAPKAAASAASSAPAPVSASSPVERVRLRGYTQVRYNAPLSGDFDAPAGQSRLRSVHDSAVSEDAGFSLRRVRLVLQGQINDRLELYLQEDFGTAVTNQSTTERRESFGQLRDAYVDIFDSSRRFRLRVGQSKVPFGWENLQSSSNRVPLDRSDAINSAVPGERDLGVVGYYTPDHVKAVWDRLEKGGQKLFGNYGAFGLAVYNGQGTNRTERNNSLMTVAMGTWPFEIGDRQVLELGGSVMFNDYRPELRSGGVSEADYDDRRVALHAILYPQPFGVQAEWTTGRAPQFDQAAGVIAEDRLNGGYVQVMYDMGETPIGRVIPYGRWQTYDGGWKASLNAPRLQTDEVEVGVEWRFLSNIELTVAYANMKRREADERRLGRAEGDLIRTQLQFTY
ncbi:MAG: porin [Caulobacterales bacterium 68-7]|nr:hypothetical protein [Caulobacterales bacterium]OJU13812.1 MAG: porin [Caulobacterales bacterium 68-7]